MITANQTKKIIIWSVPIYQSSVTHTMQTQEKTQNKKQNKQKKTNPKTDYDHSDHYSRYSVFIFQPKLLTSANHILEEKDNWVYYLNDKPMAAYIVIS